ncbi:AP-3 complex subunit delta-1 [Geranomyces variabilis]|nr:AP-3 complex subunit delta-1 [Geranomyces variabilis]
MRANKKTEDKYIAVCLDEIRNEVRKNDPDIKAQAVRKLIYLHMHGYDMAWASFHVIEVMSSPKIHYKRIGYQAAAVSFKQDTDVLMLCTNLIKKDLSSNNYNETALALHGLGMIVTPDLGRDLVTDLIAMMNHSRPYIRKRVILVLYRVFLKYPEALRLAFPRLKDKLEDPDPAVVSAVVNVICELARRNPKSYLPLAPQLYGLLTNSTNNWMLIKIIKLFASLTPLEPRLTKKLVPQITNLIQSTSAMSLLYECIHTVIVGGMISLEQVGGENEAQDEALAKLCTSKLKIFIGEPDQNLKYLGLYALSKLLAVRPKAVVEHRDTILSCLDDADVSIRMRALDIVTGMVTPGNLVQITRKLMTQVLPSTRPSGVASSYPPPSSTLVMDSNDRTQVIERIIGICSGDTYANVTNFEWYISVLVDLVRAKGVDVGGLLASQLVDVAVRVSEVREFAVQAMIKLLSDRDLLATSSWDKNNTSVLWAAAWIVGEYSANVAEPVVALDCFVAKGTEALPPRVQASYLHNLLKLYVSWATGDGISANQLVDVTTRALSGLERFKTSADLEVQERACEVFEILSLVPQDDPIARAPVLGAMSGLFAGELNPVGSKAQKRVAVPEGLDLDAWICEPEPEPVIEVESTGERDDAHFWDDGRASTNNRSEPVDPVEAERRRRERAEHRQHDPFYIPPASGANGRPLYDDIDVNEIPIVKLDFDISPTTDAKPKKSKRPSQKLRDGEITEPPPPVKAYKINRGAEMPVGAEGVDPHHDSDDDAPDVHMDEITKAVMSVDLTQDHDPVRAPSPPPLQPYTSELLVTRKKKPKTAKIVEVGDGDGSPAAPKVKKKKTKVVDSESALTEKPKKTKKKKSISSAPLHAQAIPDKGLLAVRGLDASTPYERLSSPAPSPAFTPAPEEDRQPLLDLGVPDADPAEARRPASDFDAANGAVPGNEEDGRIWVNAGGDDNLSVHSDWDLRENASGDDGTILVSLMLKFTNLSEQPRNPATLYLSYPQATTPQSIALPALPGTFAHVCRTLLRVPQPPAGHLLEPMELTLSGLDYPVSLLLLVTLNFAGPAQLARPSPTPDEFATRLRDARDLHTSSTQFHLTAASGGAGPAAIVARIAARLRMAVVETIESAATLWAWTSAADQDDGGWCAALVRVNKGARGSWVVKVEVRACDRALVDGVVNEVGDWSVGAAQSPH